MSFDNNKVAVTFTDLKGYPEKVPFHPPDTYPEYPGSDVDPDNLVYHWVRETLYRLGLDRENFNTPRWSPLKDIVEPGMTVFIKPNTGRHSHLQHKDIFSVIIHASILRPVLDYVCIALKNEGRIIIGDSQMVHGLFDEAMAVSKIDELLRWYRNQTPVPIECMDLRMNRAVRTWLYGMWARKKIEADPRGYQCVNLGDLSYFKGIDPKRLRVAIAGYKNIYKHHSQGRHEYIFPNSVLASDAIINIPKMKTHRRTGITLALKNFMGLPAWKDSLPHFITGSVEEGGDQYIYPSLRKKICTRLHDQIQTNPFILVKFLCAVIKKIIWNSRWIFPFKDNIYEAMWYGNNTLWRTLLDLNRAVIYTDKHGNFCGAPQRRYFCVMDGIIAGEGDGPVSPDAVTAGVLMTGFNPVAFDAVAASLMGFDINKIPLIRKGLEDNSHPLPLYSGSPDDIQVLEGEKVCGLKGFQEYKNLKFEPHPNWKGHIERE